MIQKIEDANVEQIPGYTATVYQHENGRSVVYRPILTPEEYEKRRASLYRAAERFARHMEDVERRKLETSQKN